MKLRERLVQGESLSEEEERFTWSLRPKDLSEFIGQTQVTRKLGISIKAAKERGEPLEHVLLHGPPGLGKTTLANIIAYEMGVSITVTSGPALERAGDLMGILTNLKEGDVLFVDEIHRLGTTVEEFLYPAMEDFRVDFVVDKGAFAKTIKVPLKPFTLVGATTRAGFLSAPLRNRFGLFYHLDFYPIGDLARIIKRASSRLGIRLDEECCTEIAKRSRGTPRVAHRLLRRVRDYGQVVAKGNINVSVVKEALELEGVDELGLDEFDRKLLKTIIEFYDGGPVGIEAIAATLNEEADTIVDMIEPYLLKIGMLSRTRTGRKVSIDAYRHLKFTPPKENKTLF